MELKPKKELAEMTGLSYSTIHRYYLEMMRLKDFRIFVHKFSYKTVKLEEDGFKEYLKYKEKEYHKSL